MLEKLEALIESLDRPEITVEELFQWKKDPVTRLLMIDFMTAYIDNLETLSEMIPFDDEARSLHARTIGEQSVYKKVLDYIADIKAELAQKEEGKK